MNKEEKEFQVWTKYDSSSWGAEEFDTFTECVNFIEKNDGGFKMRITKLVGEQTYNSKLETL